MEKNGDSRKKKRGRMGKGKSEQGKLVTSGEVMAT